MKKYDMNSNMANKETKNMKSTNLIKKIMIVALVVTVITMVAISLSACKVESVDFQTKVDATKNAKVVVCNINVKDGGVEVYDYAKTITVDGENATVIEKTKSLGDGFQLVENEKTSEVAPIDKTTFCPLNVTFFQAGMSEEKSGKETKYGATVDKATIKAFIGLAIDVDIDGDGAIVLTSDEGKINSLVLTYKTSTGKDVTVSYDYQY